MFSPEGNMKSGWKSYARSKLALSILAHHLNGKDGIHAISVHPGIVQTSLSKPISSKTKNLLHMIRFNRFTDTLEEAANNVVEAIETQHFTGTYRNGKYFSRECRIVRCAKNGSELENLSSKMIQFILNDDNN
ncbi:unnamed protein product [Dracunculus medinensis]|uniref:Short chain dehydrogenase n=1 Tax=Dracunculus medinensis TaxID=318479 RepID=A0A0N4UH56_DRAME|nr:unnamed protein product [Dracunculus medinensis]